MKKMINFFRKIRKQLAEDNKPKQYLRYAIGEILLVTIGILLALQLNNWNESRKNNTKLKNIYKILKQDLITDTSNIASYIAYYDRMDSLQVSLLKSDYPKSYFDTINESNYKDYSHYRCLNCNYEEFHPQKKAYELLKNFDEENRIYEDSLSQYIIGTYNYYLPELDTYIETIKNQAYENVIFLEQFPWYIDWLSGVYNEESVLYFSQNQTYMKKVATFNMLIIDNYLRELKKYKEESFKILKSLEERKF